MELLYTALYSRFSAVGASLATKSNEELSVLPKDTLTKGIGVRVEL